MALRSRKLPPPRVKSAKDLTEGDLWLICELQIKNGGYAATRCWSIFGYEPELMVEYPQIEEWIRFYSNGKWAPWIALGVL